MSPRCTIKDERDEAPGQGFHLYEDLADERDSVTLDLWGLHVLDVGFTVGKS